MNICIYIYIFNIYTHPHSPTHTSPAASRAPIDRLASECAGVYICVCVCIYIYIYIYVCVCVYMYLCVRMCAIAHRHFCAIYHDDLSIYISMQMEFLRSCGRVHRVIATRRFPASSVFKLSKCIHQHYY